MSETYEEVAPKHRWRDPKLLWRLLLAAYLATIAILLVLTASESLVWALYAGYLTIDQQLAGYIDLVAQYADQTRLPVILICGVFTLLLVHRLIANAHARGAPATLVGPIAGAAFFIIPFVSFVMPPLVMGAVWRTTFEHAARVRRPHGRIATWWAAYLIGNIAGTAMAAQTGGYFQAEMPEFSPEQMMAILPLSILRFGALSLAGIMLLWIFATLVKHQRPDPHEAEVFA